MDRVVNILVECPSLIPSVQVGVLNSLKPLQAQGKCIFRFKKTTRIKKTDLVWCDVIICVRGSERISKIIVQEAKRLGRFIVYYLDDDLLNIPMNISCTDYYLDQNVQADMKTIMDESDVLWVVNENIGRKYSSYFGGNYILSRVPVIDGNDFNPDTSTIRIIYAGSIDHNNIVQQYLSPVVEQLCKEFGDRFQFVFLGVNPKLSHLKQVTTKTFIDNYADYKTLVDQGGFHIGLAPIYTSEFYQSKYYNKFVEYTSMGAVGIYTDTSPYTLVIKHGVNGYLCNNTPEYWYQTIKHVAENHEERQNCFLHAQGLLKSEFNPDQVAKKLENDIPQLVNHLAPHVEIADVSLSTYSISYYLDKSSYLWKAKKIMAIPIIISKAVGVLWKKIEERLP